VPFLTLCLHYNTPEVKNVRVSVQYKYGVTNILGKLNKNDLEYDNFKGNSSLVVLAGIS
jgi:hypothetical protein